MNGKLANGQTEAAAQAYRLATAEGGKASDCVACRACEKACPQHLPITDYLQKGAEMFE